MKEEYLHFIWRFKRLPFHLFKTTDGRKIQILNPGIWNRNESGPDFWYGKIKVDDVIWSGTIEMHLNSSDWYLHNHQNDSAYDSVILHVVLNDDQPVFVNSRRLLTLELKEWIDRDHFDKFKRFKMQMNDFPCEFGMKELDGIFLKNMMDRSLVNRLQRKVNELKLSTIEVDELQILYSLLGKAFGLQVNRQPFEELTSRMPFAFLKQFQPQTRVELLAITSGCALNIEVAAVTFHHWTRLNKLHDLGTVNPSSWKRGGVRPKNQPQRRLLQFASLVADMDFVGEFITLPASESYALLSSMLNKWETNTAVGLSKEMKDLIVINCFVPFLWWIGESRSDEEYQDKVINVLLKTKAEKNHIISKWRTLGVMPKNAYESQALIEIFNEFCSNKQCLNCDVGVKLLRK